MCYRDEQTRAHVGIPTGSSICVPVHKQVSFLSVLLYSEYRNLPSWANTNLLIFRPLLRILVRGVNKLPREAEPAGKRKEALLLPREIVIPKTQHHCKQA